MTKNQIREFIKDVRVAHDAKIQTRYTVTLEKLAADKTTAGYLATYEVKQGTAVIGKIDIPKDFLVKSGDIKTVTKDNEPKDGYTIGQKYLDFVVNTVGSDAADQHIYILVQDLVDAYLAGNGLALGENNTFKVKIAATGANGLSVDADGVKLALATADTDDGEGGTTAGTAGAMSGTDKTRLDALHAASQETFTADDVAYVLADEDD